MKQLDLEKLLNLSGIKVNSRKFPDRTKASVKLAPEQNLRRVSKAENIFSNP